MIFPSILLYALLSTEARESSPAASPSVDWREPAPVTLLPVDEDDYDYSERGKWYLQGGGGLVTTQDSDGPDEDIEFDEGYLVSLALGHRFGSDDDNPLAFDLELESVWTDQDADNEGLLEAVSDVTQLGFFLNGLGEVRLARVLGLYAGGGLGLSLLDIGTESDSLNDFNEEDGPFFAWQAKGGLRWWTSDKVSLNVGYRFLNVDDAEIDDDLGDAEFDLETQQHMLELGVRFQL